MIILSSDILDHLGGFGAISAHPDLAEEHLCLYLMPGEPEPDLPQSTSDDDPRVFVFGFDPAPQSALEITRQVVLNLSIWRARALPEEGVVFLGGPIALEDLARRVRLCHRFPHLVTHRAGNAAPYDDLVFGGGVTALPLMKIFFLNMYDRVGREATATSLDILKQHIAA